jgi:hypothetical protein
MRERKIMPSTIAPFVFACSLRAAHALRSDQMCLKVRKFIICILTILGSSSAIYRCSEEDISYQLVTEYIYQNHPHILHAKVIIKLFLLSLIFFYLNKCTQALLWPYDNPFYLSLFTFYTSYSVCILEPIAFWVNLMLCHSKLRLIWVAFGLGLTFVVC